MNPSLERCSEFSIDEERGPLSVVILNFVPDVPDLGHLVPVNIALYLLSEHLSDAVLADIIEGSLPVLSNILAPLLPPA